MSKPKPIFNELTSRAATASSWSDFYSAFEHPSHIIRSEGFGRSGIGGIYDLYEEMEEKDGHLFAVLQTRKNGLLSCPRRIAPASSSQRDGDIARFVEQTLNAIPDLNQTLLHILDAIGKGFSVQEILWQVQAGRIGIAQIKSRAPWKFLFGPDGALRLSPWSFPMPPDPASDQTALSRSTEGSILPARKFIVFTFNGLYGNPLGRGLCARAYWYYWFKKNNLKFWVIFNEKFGNPTVVGKYRPGSTEEDRNRLYEVIQSIQSDTGITIPDSITLELLEARRSGNISTYRELADWCNDEISKIVLGATLTASEGRRSGSMALGQVHDRVRGEYVEADARALENVINSQLIRWLVDFNFGVDAECPRWIIDTSAMEDFERDIAIDKELIAAGVALPKAYFYEKYQRPAPAGNEPALRYDDENLFQYHLRYGVLTINEARERLGLAPVAWGEKPVSASSPMNDSIPSDPAIESAAHEAESDGLKEMTAASGEKTQA